MTLIVALVHHQGALRAALRAEYGIDLREVVTGRAMPPGDLADLVAWLPAGCPLWQDYGGPAALSSVVTELRILDYSVRVLDYHQSGGKGKRPDKPEAPPLAHEQRAQQSAMDRKAARHMRRAGR